MSHKGNDQYNEAELEASLRAEISAVVRPYQEYLIKDIVGYVTSKSTASPPLPNGYPLTDALFILCRSIQESVIDEALKAWPHNADKHVQISKLDNYSYNLGLKNGRKVLEALKAKYGVQK